MAATYFALGVIALILIWVGYNIWDYHYKYRWKVEVMPLDPRQRDITWKSVGMSYAEMDELVRLIDDDPVDEDALKGIRRKLAHKMKELRGKARKLDLPIGTN